VTLPAVFHVATQWRVAIAMTERIVPRQNRDDGLTIIRNERSASRPSTDCTKRTANRLLAQQQGDRGNRSALRPIESAGSSFFQRGGCLSRELIFEFARGGGKAGKRS